MPEPLTVALGLATAVGGLFALSRPGVKTAVVKAFSGSRAQASVSGSSQTRDTHKITPKPGPYIVKLFSKVRTPMNEPVRNADPQALHPTQRANVLAFIAAVNVAFPQSHMRIGETYRTQERQAWLFATSTPAHWKTNCDGNNTLSMHQYGLATDLVIINPDGSANWDGAFWKRVYATVPPSSFGLETIPQELVHLQLKGSQAHYVRGRLQPDYLAQLSIKVI